MVIKTLNRIPLNSPIAIPSSMKNIKNSVIIINLLLSAQRKLCPVIYKLLLFGSETLLLY